MTQSQSGTSRTSQEPFLNQLELACVYDILTEISFFCWFSLGLNSGKGFLTGSVFLYWFLLVFDLFCCL